MSLSSLPVEQVNLHPGEESLVCPDCSTWCPITGLAAPKVSPHSDRGLQGQRCRGSNQIVAMDMVVEDWQRRSAEMCVDARSRRGPGRVVRKPQAAVPTPVGRLAQVLAAQERTVTSRLPELLTAAHDALAAHQRACPTCDGRRRCPVGTDLEYRWAEVRATATVRGEHEETVRRRQEQADLARVAGQRRESAARNRELLRRAGDTERRRSVLPVGTVLPREGREVPLQPRDVAAHDARQAALGRSYAARAARCPARDERAAG
ncbi:hypothetical protein [Streptomyces sp. SDr-06]|uniref:hypothetical protein n=1 Tax=Streptomyces sp. SDr-06 TaxID=2267702 RepID=UPI001678C5FB|nr:hypothetical protein [Streptomyces sp. SDr-06]